jgi:hypothetical protein
MTILKSKESSVVVRTQLEALHCWPDIPKGHPSQFLQHPHRHIFYIELQFKINHNNRDVEFFEMKHQIDNYLQRNFKTDMISGVKDFGAMSCEMLCEDLLQQFNHLNAFQASVFEDNECGSIMKTELPSAEII